MSSDSVINDSIATHHPLCRIGNTSPSETNIPLALLTFFALNTYELARFIQTPYEHDSEGDFSSGENLIPHGERGGSPC